jgi:hypothetical protein
MFCRRWPRGKTVTVRCRMVRQPGRETHRRVSYWLSVNRPQVSTSHRFALPIGLRFAFLLPTFASAANRISRSLAILVRSAS